jgi:adenosylmethionine-8-amino-7-oxononanoate aminotransferase
MTAAITAEKTSVLPRFGELAYPNIDRGEGVWLYRSDGERILDACSGGAMVACLGHGRTDIADAAYEQALRISYVYNHHFTNEAQERLADRLLDVAAPEMARVRFASGGSEANETALRLARQCHVDRGEPQRWRVISQAQAYHGALIGALGLTGRRSLQGPYREYLPGHLHIPPATRRDPDAEAALAALDRTIADAGSETIAAYFCEAVGGAALPAYSPPRRFWEGLAERRAEHGFLICFDEIVSGMGRTGSWFAGQDLPIEPDIVTAGKGLGAGYFPIAAALCREPVYDALAGGSREFEHGHTWDGAPLSCAVGLAVLDVLVEEGLVDRVRERGPALRAEVEEAVSPSRIVGEVRGRGFLLGIELVDPRDGTSFLPDELDAAAAVEQAAIDHGLLVVATHSTADGYAGDQILLAPAFVATDEELAEMIARLSRTIEDVERQVEVRL